MYGPEDVDELRKRMLVSQRTAMQTRVQMKERITHLEGELAHVTLIASALADLCMEKGLVSLDEMKARMAKIDESQRAAAEAEKASAVAAAPRRVRRLRRRD